jgi:hypothetical protein
VAIPSRVSARGWPEIQFPSIPSPLRHLAVTSFCAAETTALEVDQVVCSFSVAGLGLLATRHFLSIYNFVAAWFFSFGRLASMLAYDVAIWSFVGKCCAAFSMCFERFAARVPVRAACWRALAAHAFARGP